MRKKLKPDFDPNEVQSDLIETVCSNYKNGVSVRALAKQMEMSPMKTRKILITGGVYSTDLSTGYLNFSFRRKRKKLLTS